MQIEEVNIVTYLEVVSPGPPTDQGGANRRNTITEDSPRDSQRSLWGN